MNQEENMRRIFKEGHHLYKVNDDLTYTYQPLVDENSFIGKEKDTEPLPTYEESRDILPALVWDGPAKARGRYGIELYRHRLQWLPVYVGLCLYHHVRQVRLKGV